MEFSDALCILGEIINTQQIFVRSFSNILIQNKKEPLRDGETSKHTISYLKNENLLTKSIAVEYLFSIKLDRGEIKNYIHKLNEDIEAYHLLIWHLRELITNVEAMRTSQIEFFKTKNSEALKQSISFEKKVDAHLHDLLKSGQLIEHLNDEP